jgi:hypothetical protein
LKLVRRHSKTPTERAHEVPRTQFDLRRHVAHTDPLECVGGDVTLRVFYQDGNRSIPDVARREHAKLK